MKLGITIPVFLTVEPLLRLTRECVGRLRTQTDAHVWVVTTRLHVCSPEELQDQLQAACPPPLTVVHTPNLARSVANAWNTGCAAALAWGSDRLCIMANDALLEPECLDTLLATDMPTVDLWSGIDVRNPGAANREAVDDGADFTCFMLRPTTLERYGTFDEYFRPAYFEDNDYYARVVLGGGHCRVIHAARFYHHGSMTSRSDPDAAHHVQHWYGRNQARFVAKWGSMPAGNEEGVLGQYHKHPWNDISKPLTWWEHD